MPVRLKDIAEDLKLSKMTISKVLRGQTDISAETTARVLQRVKELNYRPNTTARSLRTGQTFTIGLIVPTIGDAFLAELARGVDEVARAAGFGLVLCHAENDPELEQQQIDLLLGRQVDALLVVTVQQSSAYFEDLARGRTVPMVLVHRRLPGAPGSFAGIHEEEIGYLAASHLVAIGCRRITYLRGPRTIIGDLRYTGFRDALAAAGVPHMAALVVDSLSEDTSEYRKGFTGMDRLLSSRIRPDGVMAYTDMMAVGAIDAALARGVSIPQTLAIVGSGNDRRLCEMRVALTSVDPGAEELGQKAGRLALRLMQGDGTNLARNVFVRPRLVERSSSER